MHMLEGGTVPALAGRGWPLGLKLSCNGLLCGHYPNIYHIWLHSCNSSPCDPADSI